jgi:hypothetical protein
MIQRKHNRIPLPIIIAKSPAFAVLIDPIPIGPGRWPQPFGNLRKRLPLLNNQPGCLKPKLFGVMLCVHGYS